MILSWRFLLLLHISSLFLSPVLCKDPKIPNHCLDLSTIPQIITYNISTNWEHIRGCISHNFQVSDAPELYYLTFESSVSSTILFQPDVPAKIREHELKYNLNAGEMREASIDLRDVSNFEWNYLFLVQPTDTQQEVTLALGLERSPYNAMPLAVGVHEDLFNLSNLLTTVFTVNLESCYENLMGGVTLTLKPVDVESNPNENSPNWDWPSVLYARLGRNFLPVDAEYYTVTVDENGDSRSLWFPTCIASSCQDTDTIYVVFPSAAYTYPSNARVSLELSVAAFVQETVDASGAADHSGKQFSINLNPFNVSYTRLDVSELDGLFYMHIRAMFVLDGMLLGIFKDNIDFIGKCSVHTDLSMMSLDVEPEEYVYWSPQMSMVGMQLNLTDTTYLDLGMISFGFTDTSAQTIVVLRRVRSAISVWQPLIEAGFSSTATIISIFPGETFAIPVQLLLSGFELPEEWRNNRMSLLLLIASPNTFASHITIRSTHLTHVIEPGEHHIVSFYPCTLEVNCSVDLSVSQGADVGSFEPVPLSFTLIAHPFYAMSISSADTEFLNIFYGTVTHLFLDYATGIARTQVSTSLEILTIPRVYVSSESTFKVASMLNDIPGFYLPGESCCLRHPGTANIDTYVDGIVLQPPLWELANPQGTYYWGVQTVLKDGLGSGMLMVSPMRPMKILNYKFPYSTPFNQSFHLENGVADLATFTPTDVSQSDLDQIEYRLAFSNIHENLLNQTVLFNVYLGQEAYCSDPTQVCVIRKIMCETDLDITLHVTTLITVSAYHPFSMDVDIEFSQSFTHITEVLEGESSHIVSVGRNQLHAIHFSDFDSSEPGASIEIHMQTTQGEILEANEILYAIIRPEVLSTLCTSSRVTDKLLFTDHGNGALDLLLSDCLAPSNVSFDFGTIMIGREFTTSSWADLAQTRVTTDIAVAISLKLIAPTALVLDRWFPFGISGYSYQIFSHTIATDIDSLIIEFKNVNYTFASTTSNMTMVLGIDKPAGFTDCLDADVRVRYEVPESVQQGQSARRISVLEDDQSRTAFFTLTYEEMKAGLFVTGMMKVRRLKDIIELTPSGDTSMHVLSEQSIRYFSISEFPEEEQPFVYQLSVSWIGLSEGSTIYVYGAISDFPTIEEDDPLGFLNYTHVSMNVDMVGCSVLSVFDHARWLLAFKLEGISQAIVQLSLSPDTPDATETFAIGEVHTACVADMHSYFFALEAQTEEKQLQPDRTRLTLTVDVVAPPNTSASITVAYCWDRRCAISRSGCATPDYLYQNVDSFHHNISFEPCSWDGETLYGTVRVEYRKVDSAEAASVSNITLYATADLMAATIHYIGEEADSEQAMIQLAVSEQPFEVQLPDSSVARHYVLLSYIESPNSTYFMWDVSHVGISGSQGLCPGLESIILHGTQSVSVLSTSITRSLVFTPQSSDSNLNATMFLHAKKPIEFVEGDEITLTKPENGLAVGYFTKDMPRQPNATSEMHVLSIDYNSHTDEPVLLALKLFCSSTSVAVGDVDFTRVSNPEGSESFVFYSSACDPVMFFIAANSSLTIKINIVSPAFRTIDAASVSTPGIASPVELISIEASMQYIPAAFKFLPDADICIMRRTGSDTFLSGQVVAENCIVVPNLGEGIIQNDCTTTSRTKTAMKTDFAVFSLGQSHASYIMSFVVPKTPLDFNRTSDGLSLSPGESVIYALRNFTWDSSILWPQFRVDPPMHLELTILSDIDCLSTSVSDFFSTQQLDFHIVNALDSGALAKITNKGSSTQSVLIEYTSLGASTSLNSSQPYADITSCQDTLVYINFEKSSTYGHSQLRLTISFHLQIDFHVYLYGPRSTWNYVELIEPKDEMNNQFKSEDFVYYFEPQVAAPEYLLFRSAATQCDIQITLEIDPIDMNVIPLGQMQQVTEPRTSLVSTTHLSMYSNLYVYHRNCLILTSLSKPPEALTDDSTQRNVSSTPTDVQFVVNRLYDYRDDFTTLPMFAYIDVYNIEVFGSEEPCYVAFSADELFIAEIDTNRFGEWTGDFSLDPPQSAMAIYRIPERRRPAIYMLEIDLDEDYVTKGLVYVVLNPDLEEEVLEVSNLESDSGNVGSHCRKYFSSNQVDALSTITIRFETIDSYSLHVTVQFASRQSMFHTYMNSKPVQLQPGRAQLFTVPAEDILPETALLSLSVTPFVGSFDMAWSFSVPPDDDVERRYIAGTVSSAFALTCLIEGASIHFRFDGCSSDDGPCSFVSSIDQVTKARIQPLSYIVPEVTLIELATSATMPVTVIPYEKVPTRYLQLSAFELDLSRVDDLTTAKLFILIDHFDYSACDSIMGCSVFVHPDFIGHANFSSCYESDYRAYYAFADEDHDSVYLSMYLTADAPQKLFASLYGFPDFRFFSYFINSVNNDFTVSWTSSETDDGVYYYSDGLFDFPYASSTNHVFYPFDPFVSSRIVMPYPIDVLTARTLVAKFSLPRGHISVRIQPGCFKATISQFDDLQCTETDSELCTISITGSLLTELQTICSNAIHFELSAHLSFNDGGCIDNTCPSSRGQFSFELVSAVTNFVTLNSSVLFTHSYLGKSVMLIPENENSTDPIAFIMFFNKDHLVADNIAIDEIEFLYDSDASSYFQETTDAHRGWHSSLDHELVPIFSGILWQRNSLRLQSSITFPNSMATIIAKTIDENSDFSIHGFQLGNSETLYSFDIMKFSLIEADVFSYLPMNFSSAMQFTVIVSSGARFESEAPIPVGRTMVSALHEKLDKQEGEYLHWNDLNQDLEPRTLSRVLGVTSLNVNRDLPSVTGSVLLFLFSYEVDEIIVDTRLSSTLAQRLDDVPFCSDTRYSIQRHPFSGTYPSQIDLDFDDEAFRTFQLWLEIYSQHGCPAVPVVCQSTLKSMACALFFLNVDTEGSVVQIPQDLCTQVVKHCPNIYQLGFHCNDGHFGDTDFRYSPAVQDVALFGFEIFLLISFFIIFIIFASILSFAKMAHQNRYRILLAEQGITSFN